MTGGPDRARFPMRARSTAGTLAMLAVAAGVGTIAGTSAGPAAGADAAVTTVGPGQAITLQVIADGIPAPLGDARGDAERGRKLIVARESANCVLCHAVPDSAVRFSGDVGPSLAGVGVRLNAAQLRLRVADNLRINPASVMPSYFKVAALDRVAVQYAGKPILTAGEVEDVVAYLGTLR